MATKKPSVKLNKNHGGKEFSNFFRFIGQVKKFKKKEDENWVEQSFFQETTTQTGKPRRVLQFILETTKGNELKIENNGMIRDLVYAYSSKDKRTVSLGWDDRKDKSKLPNESYHVMTPEWDLTEELAANLSDGAWVEVKGKYEFDVFTTDEGEVNLVKRMVTEINPVEDGQEIKIGQDKFNYVTDFNSPDFREVNTYRMQIGIRSTYQNEEDKNTKVNGVFLAYGKEKSTPRNVDLMVFHQEPEEGKASLAEAFERLNRLDFMEVQGVDNNRAEFSYVAVEEKADDNPFENVGDEDKSVKLERVTSGTKKGLEITSYVQGTYIKNMLTEEEITPVVQTQDSGNPIDIKDDELPF
jgi:hypothetical protein